MRLRAAKKCALDQGVICIPGTRRGSGILNPSKETRLVPSKLITHGTRVRFAAFFFTPLLRRVSGDYPQRCLRRELALSNASALIARSAGLTPCDHPLIPMDSTPIPMTSHGYYMTYETNSHGCIKISLV